MTIGTTLSLTAAKAVIEDLYASAKGELKQKLKRLATDAKIKSISKAIASVQKVKTMWQIDKEVPLLSFYYPSKVVVGENSKAVSSIGEIDAAHNFVIQGTVGQGKSIFLRYLCIEELAKGSRIPIFAELRRYEAKHTLKEFLIDSVSIYGVPCDSDLFDYLAESGKLVFLLDAFDEIELDAVTAVLTELEKLIQLHAKLQVIITSRPDSGIEHSPHFRIYKLASLNPADHKPFLERIIDEKNKQRIPGILAAISSSGHEIQSLLQTPLLLTLLLIIYNGTQSIPSTVSAFYEALFQTLLTRHDSSKPGFRRRRATKLGDSDLRRLFEALCYAARQQDLLVLQESAFGKTVELACGVTGIKCKPEDFAKDVTKVACLMQHEGFQYHFIHKSVVEFHAASFISRAAEETAQKFYAKLESGRWPKWQEELRFLSQIDRYRYLRYFYIPSLNAALVAWGVDPDQSTHAIQVSDADGLKVFSRFTAHFNTGEPIDSGRVSFSINHPGLGHEGFVGHSLQMSCISTLFRRRHPQTFPFKFSEHRENVTLGALLSEIGEAESAADAVKEVLRKKKSELDGAKAELAREAKVAGFVDP